MAVAALEQVFLGTVHRFQGTITKNGVIWPLTGCTVTITFLRPDGTSFTRSCTIDNGPAGIASYVTLAGGTPDLDTKGNWKRFWNVTDPTGSPVIIDTAPPGGIEFEVVIVE